MKPIPPYMTPRQTADKCANYDAAASLCRAPTSRNHFTGELVPENRPCWLNTPKSKRNTNCTKCLFFKPSA